MPAARLPAPCLAPELFPIPDGGGMGSLVARVSRACSLLVAAHDAFPGHALAGSCESASVHGFVVGYFASAR